MQNEPIRILHMIASLNVGGSQAMVLNLYRGINQEKIQFDFIIDHPNELELKEDIEKLGGKIFILPTFTGYNLIETKQAWSSFFANHSEYRVLHTHSRSYASIYLPIAKKHGIITIVHSHSTSNGKGIKGAIKDIMQYPIRYQADYKFACSIEAGKWLFGGKAVSSGEVIVLPNAIDAKKYEFNQSVRDIIRDKLGIQDSLVVGHVGRFMPPKNHHFLIQCFCELEKRKKNCKLLLVGDGELMDDIKKEVKKLGILDKVIFLGEKRNVEEIYQAMDIFVFPSLWEGLGMALIEAQASGLPCIASDNVPVYSDLGVGLIKFRSLSEPLSNWISLILGCSKIKRTNTSKYVVNSGYDIEKNAKYLEHFYQNIFKKRK